MKKFLNHVFFFVLTFDVFAGGMGARTTQAFDGLYGGAMIGVNQMIVNTKSNRSLYFSSIDASDASIRNQSTANGVNYHTIGAFYLGVGSMLSQTRFYLGGEVFLSLASREKSLNNLTNMQANSNTGQTRANDYNDINSSLTTKLNTPEFALDLKPGILLDISSMFYARVGMAFNKVQLISSDQLIYRNLTAPQLNNNSTYIESNSKNQLGLRLGLGVERLIDQHFAVTADYIYTGYQNTALYSSNPTYGQNGDGAVIYSAGFVKSFSSTPYTNAILVGLKYHA